MRYTMLCRPFRHEEERCRFFGRERDFVMPVSAKQIGKLIGEITIPG